MESAKGLLAALRAVFPDLPGFPDVDLVVDLESGEANHHTVLRDFRSAFKEETAHPSQMGVLAELIRISLSAPDTIENAWMTVFLERWPRSGPLWSSLSPETKRHIKSS
ncbi:MAG: hypothetical protein V4564_21140 [Pseudomonadota bacterium]